MLAVNDLFYLAEPMVQTLFLEDVIGWMEIHEIRYTQNVKFTGKTGYDSLFDIIIPKSRLKPERIVDAISRPTKQVAQNFVFKWIDIREVRPPESKAYAFLNDIDQSVPSDVLDALKNYEVNPILWSNRESILEELAN
jgi:hypothetical protein